MLDHILIAGFLLKVFFAYLMLNLNFHVLSFNLGLFYVILQLILNCQPLLSASGLMRHSYELQMWSHSILVQE